MIELKHRFTGALVYRSESATTVREAVLEAVRKGANLRGAALSYADLRGTDLSYADLSGAALRGADLRGADLLGAYLISADMSGANLISAALRYADLRGADLSGATMPDGRKFEEYVSDPLAGICDEPEARKRALSAWGNHSWTDCPMHAAHGWGSVEDAPEAKRVAVAAFVAVFDAKLLPKPGAAA